MVQPLLVMKKPSYWNKLPLYKKVLIYQKNLGAFHSQFVDKIKVKEIVKCILGNSIEVAPIVKILKNIDDLSEEDIHENYIIKACHGSKWNINIKKSGSYNIQKIKEQLRSWNHLYSVNGEKQYLYIQPRFFIEEKIVDKYHGKNGEAIVYMCRCIYGKVVSISVKYGDFRNDYDENWNIIGEYQLQYIEKPVHFERLIKNAEELSSLFEFVRMDFYIDVEDKIYLSEYTFSPMAGESILPHNLEYTLSKSWT